MATKMYNSHIMELITKSKRYYTLDTYIYLVHIANQFKTKDSDLDDTTDYKFFIQTGNIESAMQEETPVDSLCTDRKNLVSLLKRYINVENITIYNALLELEALNILSFNQKYKAWELTGMSNMFSNGFSEEENTGYTEMKDILLSETFFNSSLPEKRLWLILCHLKSSKSGRSFKSFNNTDFSINLLKSNYWKSILNTKCKYYAKYKINHFLKSNAELISNLDIRSGSINGSEKECGFQFAFNIECLNQNCNEDLYIKTNNKQELDLIQFKLQSKNEHQRRNNAKEIIVTSTQIYQLARAICNIKYDAIKEYVVETILNKFVAIQVYNSRDKIKSVAAYAYSTARNAVANFETNFKKYVMENKSEYQKINNELLEKFSCLF